MESLAGMNILVTGNTGYIGPVLIRHLRGSLPQHRYAGFDSGYFAHVLTGASRLPETQYDAQYWGDLREFPYDLLDSVDVVVHLAAISNDPMGDINPALTYSINRDGSIPKDNPFVGKAGAKRFRNSSYGPRVLSTLTARRTKPSIR